MLMLMLWSGLKMLSAGDGSKDEYSNHAHTAYESGALKALTQLGRSGQRAADALPAGLPSTVLLPLLAGMVAAFGLTPDRLPLDDLTYVLQLFSAIYEGRTETHLHGSMCLSRLSALSLPQHTVGLWLNVCFQTYRLKWQVLYDLDQNRALNAQWHKGRQMLTHSHCALSPVRAA